MEPTLQLQVQLPKHMEEKAKTLKEQRSKERRVRGKSKQGQAGGTELYTGMEQICPTACREPMSGQVS